LWQGEGNRGEDYERGTVESLLVKKERRKKKKKVAADEGDYHDEKGGGNKAGEGAAMLCVRNSPD